MKIYLLWFLFSPYAYMLHDQKWCGYQTEPSNKQWCSPKYFRSAQTSKLVDVWGLRPNKIGRLIIVLLKHALYLSFSSNTLIHSITSITSFYSFTYSVLYYIIFVMPESSEWVSRGPKKAMALIVILYYLEVHFK
jgi:hypothetical protein